MSVRTPAWRRPMRGRDPEEAHRASTPLELLVDLSFVVAVVAAVGAGIQVAADSLHRGLGLSSTAASLAVAVPVAAYLAAAWLVSPTGRSLAAFGPVAIGIAAVLGATILIGPIGAAPAVMATGLVVALLVGITASGRGGRPGATLSQRTEEPGL